MKARHRASVRLLGLAILVLAMSPVTAPFATLEFGQLFGETDHHVGAIYQSKTGLQQTAADLHNPSWKPEPPTNSAAVEASVHPIHSTQRVRFIPLRI